MCVGCVDMYASEREREKVAFYVGNLCAYYRPVSAHTKRLSRTISVPSNES